MITFFSFVFSSEKLNLFFKFQIYFCTDEVPEREEKALFFFVLGLLIYLYYAK